MSTLHLHVRLDPKKLVGGNFGVDGKGSAAKLGTLVIAALEREFPGATVQVSEGHESVEVTPHNADVGASALNIVGAMRKTSDYLVFL